MFVVQGKTLLDELQGFVKEILLGGLIRSSLMEREIASSESVDHFYILKKINTLFKCANNVIE